MGIGKSVIALIVICLLAFCFIAAFSMAKTDQPIESHNATTNTSVAIISGVSESTSLLFLPMVAVAGIICLFAFFMVFRKVV